MRILWLKSDLLLPLDKGGKLRTWHLMRHLARAHEITYLAFADPATPVGDMDGMREVAARVVTVPRSDAVKGSWRFSAGAAARLVDPAPYAVAKYRSRAYRAALRSLLAEGVFDLIVCDFLVPAVNLPTRLPCPSVLFTHNVEAELWRRHADTATGWLRRQLYATQHRRMLRFEGRTLRRFDQVLAVSDADAETIDRLYPDALAARPFVVPTGVDTAFFTPGGEPERDAELVFTGSMDWLPNEDAMLFFCRQVLPLVRLQEPGARLAIVGRAPTPAVKKLAREPGVEVTGRVDDVRPFMRRAAAYVVPLRIGGGTRLKIFEAMAMGKAVVSTTVGAEGLPVTDDEHVSIADDPRTFARAVVRVLHDAPHRRRLETAARALVVAEHDWSAVAGRLDNALTTVIARRRDGVRPLLAGAVPATREP